MRSYRGRCAILAALAVFAGGAARADAPIWANREWERLPLQDAGQEGKYQITALFDAFPSRILALAVVQTVDAAQDDKLAGGTYVGFHSLARWGWADGGNGELQRAEVVLNDGGQVKRATLGALRELNILESEGDRVMADFVWPVLVDGQERGRQVLRCVIRAEEPTWLYARTFVTGDEALTMKALHLYSWGVTNTAGAQPGSEQWIAGATGDGPAPAAGPLPLEEYWFFAFHRHGTTLRFENLGGAGVFLPEQLQALAYLGGGSVDLVLPEGSRAVSYALSDFLGAPAEQFVLMRAGNAARQKRLAGMDWRPNMARELQLLDANAKPMFDGLGPESPSIQAWQEKRQALAEAIEAAQGGEPGSEEELAFGRAVQDARRTLDSLWPQVLTELTQAIRAPQ